MKAIIEAELEYAVLKLFAKKIYEYCDVDSKPKFKIIIEDAERGLYSVTSESFHDADRAGFSDYLTETLFEGLTQSEAAYAVKMLEQAGAEQAAR